jgi:Icc-related predicted phosphoesterase
MRYVKSFIFLTIIVLLFSYPRSSAKEYLSDKPWKFVSIPDFLNNDVAYPEPKWDDALDYVLTAIKAEQPDFVIVAGDLVMGRWSHSRKHLEEMADIYYPAWINRMQAYGLRFYAAIGDHEIGDDPWPVGKRELVPYYKEAFRKHLKMPDNGPSNMKGLAYSVNYKNILLVVVDVFEIDKQGGVKIRVSGEQLAWVENTLNKNKQAEHIIFVGHIPILPKWRVRSSSRISLPGGSDTALWKLMKKHNVDLYLCGEVHDISIQQKNGIHQVVHGSQASNVNEFNYLIVTVYPDRLNLELKKIETVLEGVRDLKKDPYSIDPYRERIVRISKQQKAKGFSSVGRMVINKKGGQKQFEYQQGFFKSRMHNLDVDVHIPTPKHK